MRRWCLPFSFTVLAFTLYAFPVAAEPLSVFVSILPQQYYVQQIGGDHVTTRDMVFHPSWGYSADAYDLEQVPVEIEGKAPKPVQLQALIEYARGHGIHEIFVQLQFSTRSAKLLADAIDGDVVVADPLAPDWAENLREVAARVAAAPR